VKIEVALPLEIVDLAIDAIMKTARTGKFGDGEIFITPLEEVIRIRTAGQPCDSASRHGRRRDRGLRHRAS
jgi:nitrogen regulatory protein PII